MRSLESSDRPEAVVLALAEGQKLEFLGLLKSGLATESFRQAYPKLAEPVRYAQFLTDVKSWTAKAYPDLHWGLDYSVALVSGVQGSGPFLQVTFSEATQKASELLDCSDFA